MLASSTTCHSETSARAVQFGAVKSPASSAAPGSHQSGTSGIPGVSLVREVSVILRRVDDAITGWIARNRIRCLHFSLGLVFFWFGVLKFFPGLSPAENLATRTIETLTFGMIHPAASIFLLATWECAVGIALGFRLCLRATLCLLFLHMVCTFLPVIFFPQEVFTQFPHGLTLEGQYIVKNLVLLSAALMLWPARES